MVRARQATLRLIGYWAGPTAPGWPDPRDFVDPSWDSHDRDTVVDYLTRGFIVRAFGGHSTCRFCGKENGALEVSDGTSYWPDGLAHYLTEHDVRLPRDFVEHVYTELDSLSDADRETEWWRSSGGIES